MLLGVTASGRRFLSQSLTPGLITDTDVFFAPAVQNQNQILTPALITDTDSFLVPVVTQPGTYHDAFNQALNTDGTGWAGVNLRQVINSSLLSGSGTQIRVTLQAAAGSHSAIVDSAYIYQQAVSGDPYDGNGATMTQLLVSGSGSFTIAQGTSQVTDDITFAWDSTKNHVLAFHFGGTFSEIKTTPLFGGPSGAQGYFKSAADETSTANVSGYTTGATALYFVTKIEYQ